jgi:hypothetical protein
VPLRGRLPAESIVTAMQPIDEATASFLRSAADDLQRQLGVAGDLTSIGLDDSGGRVTLIATIRVGRRDLEFRGTGDSLVTAYAKLVPVPPEALLIAAFRSLLPA